MKNNIKKLRNEMKVDKGLMLVRGSWTWKGKHNDQKLEKKYNYQKPS